jgi:hypothetical protein
VDVLGETTQYGGKCGRLRANLAEVAVLKLVKMAYHLCGLLPHGLALIWFSPPCETYRWLLVAMQLG